MEKLAIKLDRYIYRMLLFTVAAIPFVQELTAFLVALTFAATVFVDYKLGKTHGAVLKAWEQRLLLALAGYTFLSIYFSLDPLLSLGNWFYVIAQYLAFGFVLLRYGQGRGELTSYSRVVELLGVFLLASVLVSGIGLLQKLLGINAEGVWVDPDQFPDLKIRVYSTLRNPNILAGYLVLAISYCVAVFDTFKKARRLRMAMLGIGMLAGLCLVYTYSRGNWIALAVSILGFCILFNCKGFIPMVVAGALGMAVGGRAVLQRLSSISADATDTSIALRLSYLESTQAMIEEHPLGVGWYGYRFAFPDYNFFLEDKSVIMYHCHNIFLNVWSELGPQGLLLFLVVWGMFIYNAWQLAYHCESLEGRTIGKGYILACLGIAIGGLTDHIYFNTQMGLFFWFLGLLVMVTRARYKKF